MTKVIVWVLLAVAALAVLWFIFFRPKPVPTACEKVVTSATKIATSGKQDIAAAGVCDLLGNVGQAAAAVGMTLLNQIPGVESKKSEYYGCPGVAFTSDKDPARKANAIRWCQRWAAGGKPSMPGFAAGQEAPTGATAKLDAAIRASGGKIA
jgi:hypothetical protein